MGKRNLKRERQRRKALAWQQRQIAAARRRRRAQIIAGVTVASLAVAGVVTGVVLAVINNRTPAATVATIPDDGADSTTTDEPTDEPTDAGAATSPDSVPAGPYTAPPDPSLAESREWTGAISTSVGQIEFTLDGVAAPQATANFIQLATDGYYDDSSCHRLTTSGIFVLQCGSLTGDGTDGPGYEFGPVENAPADQIYPAGTIAMARAASEDSQGSQFFIVYEESSIGGDYSVFGHVTSGLEAVQEVAASGTVDGGTDGQPATTVTIEWIELQ
jgi:peptidyl-prolyl cis-trans isomerase B (cyclophilin B)